MIKILLSILAIIGSALIIFFTGKNRGEISQTNNQQEIENGQIKENIKIIKNTYAMSFDDKSSFLLSKQRNKNKSDS